MQEAEFIEEIEESSEAVDIGQNIRKIRLRSCMSQEVFAERIGVSRQTVVNWERGYSLPAADKVGRIIKECSTTIEEILGTAVETVKNEECLACAEEKVCEKHEKKNKISLGKAIIITALTFVALISIAVLVFVVREMIWLSSGVVYSISIAVSLGDMDRLILIVLACSLVLTCVVFGIVKLINFRRVKNEAQKDGNCRTYGNDLPCNDRRNQHSGDRRE